MSWNLSFKKEWSPCYVILHFLRFPSPRASPRTIPWQLNSQLLSLGIEDPWYWFSSQFIGYLLLRFNSDFLKLIESFKAEMNLTYPSVGMHIRRTDKIWEAKFVKEEEYLLATDEYYRKHLPTVGKKKAFIASDQMNMLEVLKR